MSCKCFPSTAFSFLSCLPSLISISVIYFLRNIFSCFCFSCAYDVTFILLLLPHPPRLFLITRFSSLFFFVVLYILGVAFVIVVVVVDHVSVAVAVRLRLLLYSFYSFMS